MEIDGAPQGACLLNAMKFDTNIQMKIQDAYAARHEPEAQRLLARAFWAFLVVTFGVVASMGIAYGVWQFLLVPQHNDTTVGVRPQTIFTRAELEATLKSFDERAARFQTRMTAPVSAKDPS